MVKGRSARGEVVDFDLLKIKEQIAAAPKTNSVVAREDFIDQKFKRRLRKLTENVTASATQVATNTTPVAEPLEEPTEFEDVNDDILDVTGFVDNGSETVDNSAEEEQEATMVPTSTKKLITPSSN